MTRDLFGWLGRFEPQDWVIVVCLAGFLWVVCALVCDYEGLRKRVIALEADRQPESEPEPPTTVEIPAQGGRHASPQRARRKQTADFGHIYD